MEDKNWNKNIICQQSLFRSAVNFHIQNNQINTSLHETLHQNTPINLTDILHQCGKILDLSLIHI